MSHSLQVKILIPFTLLSMVFFGGRPVLADSPHAQHTPQPSSSSPQVAPAAVPPPTAASTNPTPPPADQNTDNTSSNQDTTPANPTPAPAPAPAPKPVPVEKSIYTDLTDQANAQARQEQARQQLSPLTPPAAVQPVAVKSPTQVATAPIKTVPEAHVWSYIPFINNDAGLSASAYDTTNGLSAQTTKMLTMASYGAIIIGIALVLIKPKNIAFLSPTFKKPISSI